MYSNFGNSRTQPSFIDTGSNLYNYSVEMPYFKLNWDYHPLRIKVGASLFSSLWGTGGSTNIHKATQQMNLVDSQQVNSSVTDATSSMCNHTKQASPRRDHSQWILQPCTTQDVSTTQCPTGEPNRFLRNAISYWIIACQKMSKKSVRSLLQAQRASISAMIQEFPWWKKGPELYVQLPMQGFAYGDTFPHTFKKSCIHSTVSKI